MSRSTTGYQRTAADQIAKRRDAMQFTRPSHNKISAVVVYSSAGTNAKYLDSEYGDSIVCGGYARFFAGIGVGIQTNDVKNGDSADYDLECRAWVELTVSETPANNTVMYWDAGTSLLTSTAGSNQRAGIAVEPGIGEACYQVIATSAYNTKPAGTWVHIQLQPVQ